MNADELLRVGSSLAVAGCACALVVAAGLRARQRAVDRDLRGPEGARATSPIVQLLAPLIAVFLPIAGAVRAPEYRRHVQKLLTTAGRQHGMSVDEFLAFKGAAAVFLGAVLAVVTRQQSLWALTAFAVAGSFYPDVWIREHLSARRAAVLQAFPFFVDILSLCVEAGLDFPASLERFVQRSPPSPLREEIQQVIGEVTVGATRKQALRSFAQRVNLVDVQIFTGVVAQADDLGASIADTLKELAARMRAERFAKAERRGAALTQKILVPVIFLLVPAALAVLVGPSIVILIRTFR